MNIYFYVIGAVLIILFGIIVSFRGEKKLNKEKKKYYKDILEGIETNKSPKEKIIDYDKLYHKILRDLGYKGDFGSILKSNPDVITNINKIWQLHKLRNKLVHELDNTKEEILIRGVNSYKEEIVRLLK